MIGRKNEQIVVSYLDRDHDAEYGTRKLLSMRYSIMKKDFGFRV